MSGTLHITRLACRLWLCSLFSGMALCAQEPLQTFRLIEQLDQLFLSYQQNKNWTIQTELGLEARASIKYRIETGHPKPVKPE